MRVAIVRGPHLNKWEMQNFEPLTASVDIIACCTTNNHYPTNTIKLPIHTLKSSGELLDRLGVIGRIGTKLLQKTRPPDRMKGLEEWLAGFDVIHSAETGIPFSEQAVFARNRYKKPLVLTCWETIPHAYEEDLVIRERRQFVRQHTDLFLATSQRAAHALLVEGVNKDRIRVIMPGVDTDRFRPGIPNPALLKSHGLDGEEIVLLFVGRLILEKGGRELVTAFGLLLKALPPHIASKCRLLIAGDGPQKAFLQAMIDAMGKGQARIIGTMDYMRIHLLHQLADIFVLPSVPTTTWEEQYGMVLAEALSCGTPVVSTASGGVPEVVGDAGLLVPPLDPQALMEALRSLVLDIEFRNNLGAKARERAVQCLNANRTALQIQCAYRELKCAVRSETAVGAFET